MSIRYKTTRGQQKNLSFEEVVLLGLGNDKGLFIPERIPIISLVEIEKYRSLSYSELSYEVISKFVGLEDMPEDVLRSIIDKSFKSFRNPEVTPSRKLKDFWVLELFHGPTFAFKDVALQFLGNLFEYFLSKGSIQTGITILGATSGDTGSAAIYGLRGKANVNCFILYPEGKVSAIQERQMTTILDQNVDCISINGDFDAAQAVVKAAFADEDFRRRVKLGAINSINWARILAQITYYFYSWLRVTDDVEPSQRGSIKLSYVVPTGNFGDILAGYYAKQMGLPIDKLVVATNENDVLHRFFVTGSYTKLPAVLTLSPSMDISVSSNFERYLYYLAGQNADVLMEWMDRFESKGELTVSAEQLKVAQKDFVSYASYREEIVQVMRSLYLSEKYLVCPHTATGAAAIQTMQRRAAGLSPSTTVLLATAHPAKFEEAVSLALRGHADIPQLPLPLKQLFALPVKKTQLSGDLEEIQLFIVKRLASVKKIGYFAYDNSWNVLVLAGAAALSAFVIYSVRKR